MKNRLLTISLSVAALCVTLVYGLIVYYTRPEPVSAPLSLEDIPSFDGTPYVVLNDNVPTFTEEELTTASYELFSPLDAYGRCGAATACIGRDLMPTEERGAIGSVKPTGWQTSKYDFVDGKYLYNRCHLIGFQLSGENANERNLITGTRYLNVDGMLPFENMVADYVKETDNHVLYRVTPLFEDDELIARGVTMEAYSVEDDGEGICFYVYCYNVQPGVTVCYADGTNALDATASSGNVTFILNTSSKKIHSIDCEAVATIAENNRRETTLSLETLLADGYRPCTNCLKE